jgi:RAP domain
MIAIEYDGSSHYLSNVSGVETKQQNGPTKAKRHLLQELHWNVINLLSWMDARREHQMSEEWVMAKLSEADVEC